MDLSVFHATGFATASPLTSNPTIVRARELIQGSSTSAAPWQWALHTNRQALSTKVLSRWPLPRAGSRLHLDRGSTIALFQQSHPSVPRKRDEFSLEILRLRWTPASTSRHRNPFRHRNSSPTPTTKQCLRNLKAIAVMLTAATVFTPSSTGSTARCSHRTDCPIPELTVASNT
jgi:hypothetical protein